MAITAGPGLVDHHWSIVIGAVGGLICTAGIRYLEVLKLDDVVGAIPAHLFCGIWGTLVVSVWVDPDIERLGQDAGELGIESYPEFVLYPEEFGDED